MGNGECALGQGGRRKREGEIGHNGRKGGQGKGRDRREGMLERLQREDSEAEDTRKVCILECRFKIKLCHGIHKALQLHHSPGVLLRKFNRQLL